jgi:Tfp pilus assembly protein PilO
MKLGFDPDKYRFALIPGTIILLAVFSLVIALPGQIRFIRKQNRQLKRTSRKVEELKTKHLLLSSLDEEELKQRAKTAVKALPEDKDIPIILQSLREAVTEPGFLIEELAFSPGKIEKDEEEGAKNKRIEELPIKVTVIGNSDNLLDLFSSLEQRLPLYEIRDSKISNLGRAGNRLRLELSVLTFYSPPVKTKNIDKITTDELVLKEDELSLLDKLNGFTLTEIEPVTVPEGTDSGTIKENPFL